MKSGRLEFLSIVDKEGNPQPAIIKIDKVTKRGADLPSGKYHANYIDNDGYYDITKFFDDHIYIFPGLDNVGIGQFAPYNSTKVDCESLFSQSGDLSYPKQSSTKIRTFERLIISKH